jgi:hypothetical protein
LGNDVGVKNIANAFDKFKHQHKLFAGQQKEEEFNKTFSVIKRTNFEVPLARRTTLTMAQPASKRISAAPEVPRPKLRRFTTVAGVDIKFNKDVSGLGSFGSNKTAKDSVGLSLKPLQSFGLANIDERSSMNSSEAESQNDLRAGGNGLSELADVFSGQQQEQRS